MKFVEAYLRRPTLLVSLVLLAAVIGGVAYFQIPINLFPDSERPKIAIVTAWPGASAADVEADVTRRIETEVQGIEEVRLVTSTSRDEVSAVTVEFRYSKDLDAAATDVSNALDRIRAELPVGIRPPMIFKVSSATPAVMTIALRPAEGSPLDLAQVRQLAENEVRDRLLRIPEVANVEVFGAHEPAIDVRLDRDLLDRYGISALDVRRALLAFDADQPVGLVTGDREEFLLKRTGRIERPEEAGRIVVAHLPGGDVHLGDVAEIRRGEVEPRSAYHGDGEPAIALNVQRSRRGNAVDTIAAVSRVLPELEREFPGIAFSIPDNQATLIDLSISNMKGALRDAIILTILVIFLFLGDLRSMLLTAISIPFTYLLTFLAMWALGIEFNIVTLTAVIIAVGMLVDDTIVVLENIDRHWRQLGEELRPAVIGGTQEVMLAILSGTYSLVMVLVPIMFIGGYVQTVLRPFTTTLSLALLASYVVSVTVIPLFAPVILRRPRGAGPNAIERAIDRLDRYIVDPLRSFYGWLAALGLRHRWLFLVVGVAVLVVSLAQMPLIGRNLMPPMDTGILVIRYETDANGSLTGSEAVLSRIEAELRRRPEVETISSVVGSEPAVISFGAERTVRQGMLTVHLVDRFHREKTIWEIEKELRERLRDVPGLASLDVFEYGATPLSSIRAPVDVMISGPDLAELDRIAREVERRLREHVRDLTSISRSWRLDTLEAVFRADPEAFGRYGIAPPELAAQLQGAVRGMPASTLRIPNQSGIPWIVRLRADQRARIRDLETFPVRTRRGVVPLAALGRIDLRPTPEKITHQGLQRTIDVQAYRGTRPVSHLQEDVEKALAGLELPPGYTLSHEGEVKQMNESFGRLARALLLAMVLLYFALVPAFDSFLHPVTIMSAIPLGLIGAAWGMLLADKHGCMPSMMGMILLAGIVVKNSILLIDFTLEALRRGVPRERALLDAVSVRTRPILMTAFSTVVGMIPVAMEWAIGLERLSPLAVVAIGGLLVATFLTMIYVPILFTLFDDLATRVRAPFARA